MNKVKVFNTHPYARIELHKKANAPLAPTANSNAPKKTITALKTINNCMKETVKTLRNFHKTPAQPEASSSNKIPRVIQASGSSLEKRKCTTAKVELKRRSLKQVQAFLQDIHSEKVDDSAANKATKTQAKKNVISRLITNTLVQLRCRAKVPASNDKAQQDRERMDKRTKAMQERVEKLKKKREENLSRVQAFKAVKSEEEQKKREQIEAKAKLMNEKGKQPQSKGLPKLKPIQNFNSKQPQPNANVENYEVSVLEPDATKPIPLWAANVLIEKTAKDQSHKMINYTQIFKAGWANEVDLNEIFGVKRKKFAKRSSSGEWTTPTIWQTGLDGNESFRALYK